MEQSEQVAQVLNSKEFQTWLPDSREYIEITKIWNTALGLILSGGLAAVCMLAFVRNPGNPAIWNLEFFGITAIFMAVYVAIVGFGNTRIVRIDRDSLEIGSTKEVLLNCAWSDILTVKKVGYKGFEITTAQGSTVIAYEAIPVTTNGYAAFFFHVLQEIANGLEGSALSKYKLPIELEEGKRYVYRVKKGLTFPVSGVMLIAGVLSFVDIVQGKDVWQAVARLVIFAVLGSVFMLTEWPNRKSARSTIWITGHLLNVETAEGVVQYPFKRQSPRLGPSCNPTPFLGAESYGTEEESVTIDRRFLEPI